MNKLIAVFLGLVLTACEARGGLRIVGNNHGQRIEFINCSQPEQVLPVYSLRIVDRTANRPVTVCSLEAASHASLEAPGHWEYAKQPKGYRMRGCGPLVEGHRYEVRVSMAHVTHPSAVFRVGPKGSVTMQAGGCD